MNIKLQRALFLLTHPGRRDTKYKTDEEVDAFVRELIDCKDEVEHIETTSHEIVFRFRGKIFGLWIANFPYAALQKIHIYDSIDSVGSTARETLEDVMPSPHTVDRFFKVYAKELQGKSGVIVRAAMIDAIEEGKQ